jgi:hypothetical protein
MRELKKNDRTNPFHLGVKSLRLFTLTGLSTVLLVTGIQTKADAVSSVKSAVSFSCNDSESTIKAKGGASVTVGSTSFYIGYQQVSSTNKNPILIRFDSGNRTWCKTDYETTGDDNTGYALLWNGQGSMYGVFTATGTQGSSSQDFRRFATKGWLTSYGQGGGRKVSIIAKINPTNGTVTNATFLSALLSSGSSNSLVVKRFWLNSAGNLVVNADSYFSPRRVDRSRMTCSGNSPFDYTIQFVPNLSSAVRAVADRCS